MVDSQTFLNVMDLAIRGPRTIFLKYETSSGGITQERHLEPYSLTPGREEAILRAFQISPEEGWRYFLLDKIVGIRLGEVFEPRQALHLELGELEDRFNPWPESWDEDVIEYRNAVVETLANMNVDSGEVQALQHMRDEIGISVELMRGVHYMIFKNCLEQIVEDGVVTEAELAQIKELNACLQRCGAGIME